MTEKEEHVRIYEEIKQREAAYAAANPGRYYLLSDYERDDIDSYHQIEAFKRMPPTNVIRFPTPQKTLREHVEEMIAEQAEQLMLKRFEADLVKHVREINYGD